MRLVIILPALTIHEFAHAYSADKMGDPTARLMGRMTLNPLAHIDPIGTILVPIFFRFGWAKPVPVNPMNFRNPRRGSLITSAAGPAANVMLALVIGIGLRITIALAPTGWALGNQTVSVLFMWTYVNLILAIFNLIPLGPLDGHHIVEALLPYHQLQRYRSFNRYGMFILFGVMFLARPLFDAIVFAPAYAIATLLSGPIG
ncbi:MAG: site-2 protease family protein [Candidatus Brocadiae bacterium]|nr:site-2 protease family protein [Candidatus Brocadiia bacterium]